MNLQTLFVSLFLFLSFAASAADLPGGLNRSSEMLPGQTFEMTLAPGYLLSPGGAYLTSELRYQVSDAVGTGFGFGAGEVGFNFGGNALWSILPDNESQPAVSVLGGLYFNRINLNNFMVLRIVPMVSKSYKMEFGKIVPYAGLHLLPSFSLSGASNDVSVKASMGVEFDLKSLSGLKLRSEFAVGVVQSFNELVFGLSYPFKSL